MTNTRVRPAMIWLGRILLLLLVVAPAFSQLDRGNIEGLVTDPSGAIVPGAKVQVIQMETNSPLDYVTNSEGLFVAPNLTPANYKVVVQKEGFASVTREGIEIRPNNRTRVDVQLQTGSLSESITVSTDAPLLDTTPIAHGAGMKEEVLKELPIISSGGTKRDIASYLAFLPPTYNGAGTTEIFIDGAPATQLIVGMNGRLDEVGPMIESVGEVNVIANAFNAEYGGFANSFTNVVVKSGNNDLHGSIYNHTSNDFFNARSFFQGPIMRYRQNEGGIDLSGPLVLPKIYNGRNKTFVYGSLGWFFNRYGFGGSLMTIPTPAFAQGDFSGLVNATGAQLPIFDPATTVPVGTSYQRTQFPGNVIPQTRITTWGKLMQQYMPKPDLPGLTNNYYSKTSGNYWPMMNTWLPLVKVDHSISDKQKIMASYTYQYRPRVLHQNGYTEAARIGEKQTNPLDYQTDQIANSWKIRLNDNYIVTPTMINYISLSFDRYYNQEFNKTTGQGWDKKLGITGFENDDGAFPATSFGGGYTSPGGWGRGWHQNWHDVRYSIVENLSWVRGNHSMKFGMEVDRDIINDQNTGNAAGSFSFNARSTSQPNNTANVSTWGNSYASFLLGAVSSANTAYAPYWGLRRVRYGLFAQDEFHATRKLTLSYGLRWDFDPPFSEVHNQMSSFLPGIVNPLAGGLKGGLAFIGSGPGRCNCNFQDSWKKGFGPRLGLAYQLDQKTVIRVSGGIYHSMSGNGTSVPTSGFGVNPSFSSSDSNLPLYYIETGTFPQNFMRPPLLDPSFLNGQSTNMIPRKGTRLPETYSWNFSIQREVFRGTTLELTYTGSKNVHTASSSNLNYRETDIIQYGSTLLQPITSPLAIAAGFKEPFPGFANQTGANTVLQAIKPYPQFTGVSVGGSASDPVGQNKNNQFQARANKRMSRGMTVSGWVDWSKNFSMGTALTPTSRQWNFGGGSAVQLSANWTYDLPFGKGKLGTNIRAINAIIEGWKINGYVRYSSGGTLGVSGSSGDLGRVGFSQRATIVPGVPMTLETNPRKFDPVNSRYLNAAAWTVTTGWDWGNMPGNPSWLRGFWGKSESLTAGRMFRLRERMVLDFSMDATNPFNFHRWGGPSGSLTSANFGKVTSAQPGRLVQFNGSLRF